MTLTFPHIFFGAWRRTPPIGQRHVFMFVFCLLHLPSVCLRLSIWVCFVRCLAPSAPFVTPTSPVSFWFVEARATRHSSIAPVKRLEKQWSATSVLPQVEAIHSRTVLNYLSFVFLWIKGKFCSSTNLDNLCERHGLEASLLPSSKMETVC